MKFVISVGLICAVMLCIVGRGAVAQPVSLTTYGTPGVIEMPDAGSAPDAELMAAASYFRNVTRTTVAFQVAPRLTAAFRYSALEGLGGALRSGLFDRSFDLHYRIADETAYRPAVALGLRDFIGTGVYSSEYIVASKQFGGRVTLTAGVGWGRLGGDGYLARAGPTSSTNQGGQLESSRWFSGDPAWFGGVVWQADARFQVKLEYSADTYTQEEAAGAIQFNSPWNIGLAYQVNDHVSVQGFYLYGAEFGVALHVLNNPRRVRQPSGVHPAPFPVRPRGASRDLGWPVLAGDVRATPRSLVTALEREGLVVEGFTLTESRATLQIWNTRYLYPAEAVGRAARVLSQMMPDSVDSFDITHVVQGIPVSSVIVQRSDVEAFEHSVDGAEKMLARARIGEAPLRLSQPLTPDLYPRFVWGLGPYLRASYFDPDRPVQVDFGLRLTAEYVIAPGLFLSGSVRKSLGGNFDSSPDPSNSVLPRVRSESNRFLSEGDPALETLTLAYYTRPGQNLYARATAGYLEGQYGGLSAEVLWKPVQSRIAFGVEVNYARQRDFDQGFGFQDYDIVTGHVSAYAELRGGYHLQVDAGRYLAGDWGATITVDRTFRNGWRIGAYATFTDVSFEDFGEGSFDKGLRIVIPLEPLSGRPSRRKYGVVLQPLTRDGGARLQVDGRLYEQVRDFHASGLESSWGRFWR